MAKEAEANAEQDKQKRETVEARNSADSAVYQAEKLRRDKDKKLADEDMKTLNEAIDAAKKVASDEKADKEAVEAAFKELNDKMMPIGAKMYEAAGKTETEDKLKEPQRLIIRKKIRTTQSRAKSLTIKKLNPGNKIRKI